MQDWKSTFHKQSWSCGTMENQELVHTNKLPIWALCAQRERIWECSIHLFYRRAGSENRGAGGLPWDVCSSCNANTTEPAGFLALTRSTGSVRCPQSLFSSFKDWYKTSMSQLCTFWVLTPRWVAGRAATLASHQSLMIWGEILAWLKTSVVKGIRFSSSHLHKNLSWNRDFKSSWAFIWTWIHL